MLIDTHCHLNDPAFAHKLPDVIERAREYGIGACIVPAYDRASLARTAALARQYPDFIFPACGLHPWFVGEGLDIDELRGYLVQPGIVAVGEIGLDFSPECPPPEAQLGLFRLQLDLAAELGLPVLIHCRKAHEELLKIAIKYKGMLRGVLHSFSGGRDLALRFIELGYYIAFSGSVTRTTAKKYHTTAEGIPLEYMLVETDAPSIATQTTLASQVEPRHTVEVASTIAELRGSTFEEIAQATTGNARRLFTFTTFPLEEKVATVPSRARKDDLILDPQSDRFIRNKMFFGLEGFQKLQKSFVAVVGLGGVGSYAAEALARAGVGRLRIIDCDKVKPSDINRQLIALSTTVGLSKTQAAAERLAAINPQLRLEPVQAFFHFDTADELITDDIDFVIDAIDSLNPKGQLIKHCMEKNIPMISALGASSRTDPFQLQLTSLNKTVNCPLARALRRHLRTKGIRDTVPVIYSPEAPREPRLPEPEPMVEAADAYVRGRLRRSLPSIPTLPGIVGLMASNYVIFELQKRE